MKKNDSIIQTLKQVILSMHSNDAIVDTVWMHDSEETVVDALTGALLQLGYDEDQLEEEIENVITRAGE